MATLIPKPTVIEAAGNKPKLIEEFVGRVNSGTPGVSVARMRSPGGWVEPDKGSLPMREVKCWWRMGAQSKCSATVPASWWAC